MGTYCFGHGCGLWMLWLYFGVARVMIICLARICISSDIRVLIYTVVSVEKYYMYLVTMTPSHPLIKPSFSLLFPIMQPLSF